MFNKCLLILASKFKAELDNLSKQYPQNEMLLLDVSRKNEEFEHLVQEHDIVIRYDDRNILRSDL